MQALQTSLPLDTRPSYEDQFNYLRIAIWMIQFRNRYRLANLPPGRYRKILNKLIKALDNAEKAHENHEHWSVHGGTALRLAKAIWSFEYRLLHPDSFQLKREEERDTAHVYYNHRKPGKTKLYLIDRAIDDFCNLRISVLGAIAIPDAKKDDVFKPNPFTKALRKLDTFVTNTRRIRNRKVFADIFPAIAAADPAHKALLTPFCEAALAWAIWLDDPRNRIKGNERVAALAALQKAQYENSEYLQTNGKPLNKAINRLIYDMRTPQS